ncbi:hypothetical protein FK178_02180 [Antarcticibacterium arcticum]|uniref:Uncharacterized protein n=1 Tax=Antarcticibacterium arcticum TaxID=2585771 RepID=A0A5B8YF49_9FLAO|nr:hypothetical protein [Antarcticibacterium arcticum]QED36592.1 hypothetical protein FK178_02180 [Antarcticibacterium arcticum]
MINDETNPSESQRSRGKDYSHIKGWGIDANKENDPTYPMKNRTNEEQEGYSWQRPPQQSSDIEILQTAERPKITSVYGTSVPPSGLSGMIRRQAYKNSESSYGRWLPLVLADRIGVYEGILQDFTRGRIPNVFTERGWNAEWEHNRTSFIVKVAATAVITAALVGVFFARKNKYKDLLH